MFISILNNVKQTESDLKSLESKNIIKKTHSCLINCQVLQ